MMHPGEDVARGLNMTNTTSYGSTFEQLLQLRGCPGVPVHEGIPFVFITIHGVMTQFVNVSFLCVPVHEDTTAIDDRKSDW